MEDGRKNVSGSGSSGGGSGVGSGNVRVEWSISAFLSAVHDGTSATADRFGTLSQLDSLSQAVPM